MIFYRNQIGFNRYNYEDNTKYSYCRIHKRVILLKVDISLSPFVERLHVLLKIK
jgi:hypothetical protein